MALMGRLWPASFDRGQIESQLGWWSTGQTELVRNCPREAEHRYGPSGYLAWHEWTEERCKTHVQLRCDCGLFLLLVTKAKAKKMGIKPE